jgi:homoserine O-acetyltransferase
MISCGCRWVSSTSTTSWRISIRRCGACEVRDFELTLPPLVLEHGGVVEAHRVRGWWAGPEAPGLPAVEVVPWAVVHDTAARPAPSRGQLSPHPVVLVIHALTGDMRAGGEGGWWAPVIGPGQPIDPTTHHVLCFNLLGGCYGTSGPVDPRFPAEAVVTTRDQARSLGLALDALGIERLALVTGGSLGGMVALALAAEQPARVERLAPIGAAQASSAWVLGFNHVQRQVIEAHGGSARGLELARQLAMLTYRAEAGLERTQGRGPRCRGIMADRHLPRAPGRQAEGPLRRARVPDADGRHGSPRPERR